MQNLLTYLNGLSLSAANKKWLAEHYFQPVSTPHVVCNSRTTRESRQRAKDFAAICSQVTSCDLTDDEILSECKAARQEVYEQSMVKE